MPLRRTKLAGSARGSDRLSREMRQSNLALFIQQFEKEAQQRMNELEAKMENHLSTVDKVFKVEMMKMPPPLQNTLMGDVMSEEDTSASEVSIAMKSESREMHRRMPSKRVKSSDSPPVISPSQRSSTKTPKVGRVTKGTRTLVGSNSTGSLAVASTTVKRSQSRLASRKTTDQTGSTQRKRKLRSVVSAGDLHCSVPGSAAHITVTTARGEMVSFSEDTKDEINLDLLDDVAWCQIQKLTSLMEYLSRRSRSER
ncbi:borealin-2 [Cololabis saira]|uniref:borealin-2 n=1 Tax=Cololabis saira TaxID=129043 RepID=UPI002AD317BA|nr:borealin-2 [Cololabis saira]